MAGLGRMHEECCRAGRSHGGGNLRADMAILAHSGDDHAPRRSCQDIERGAEALVEGIHQHGKAVDLELQHATRREELKLR
jgi:hypothetical protein